MRPRYGLRLAAALALSVALLPAAAPAAAPAAEGEAVEEIEEVEELGEIEVVDDIVVAPDAPPKELGLAEMAGRFHPALVHMPIAWLVLLLLVDVVGLGLGREPFRAVGPWLGGLTVLSFIPAATTGLIRYTYPPYTDLTEGMVFVHRNLMLLMAGLTVLAFVLRLVRRNRLEGTLKWAYLALLVAAVGIVTVAGHIGAELVFGEDYLPF